MKQITTTVRTLPEMKSAVESGEISHAAYERAFEWCAQVNTDHDWWNCTVDTYKQALAEIGFNDADITFSGFYSQGDGASFTGSPDAATLIRLFGNPPAPSTVICAEDGKETFAAWLANKVGGIRKTDFSALLPLADEGEAWVTLSRNSHRYSHSSTVTVEADCNPPEQGDEMRDLADAAKHGGEIDYRAEIGYFENAVKELYLDLCAAIYRDLRDEYEYLMGEEAVMECAEANEYHFDEGGRVRGADEIVTDGILPEKEVA